eukprot:2309555-Amphidinium_carterae.1
MVVLLLHCRLHRDFAASLVELPWKTRRLTRLGSPPIVILGVNVYGVWGATQAGLTLNFFRKLFVVLISTFGIARKFSFWAILTAGLETPNMLPTLSVATI